MKRKSFLVFVTIACPIMLLLTGCASLDAPNRESLLSAAGFMVRTPSTPKQHELYAAAPAYRIQRLSVRGKVLYAYKDEKKGVAYVGDEAAYQRYQGLAIQQRIAEENYQAAEMERNLAFDWYGAYGPWAFPRPGFRVVR